MRGSGLASRAARGVDPASADQSIADVEGGALTGRHGELRLVEGHLRPAARGHDRGRGTRAVAVLHMHAQFARSRLVEADPIDAVEAAAIDASFTIECSINVPYPVTMFL